MGGERDPILDEFLIESYENLDRLDQSLVALEDDPHNTEILSAVFRTIHTIKGTSGFLGFSKLESLTHAGENLLAKLRDRALDLTPERTSGLLGLVDAVREILASIEATQQEGEVDYGVLEARLARLLEPTPAVEAPATEVVSEERPAEASAASQPSSPRAPSVAESGIRVDVELLDRLMNLVGELVLARNQIVQSTQGATDAGLQIASQRLSSITTELQERVMKTRMQPIGTVWKKLPRVVRDLALACGKQVRVEMIGKETELDRTIIESIKDPLTHIVRNSVDHGIESPQTRASRGKPPEAVLSLRAFHEGGQVNIEIADDGGGVDTDKVRAKALERGLISEAQSCEMSETELVHLIFLPGFSTAEKVTNVSGRGVGMDVVRSNIETIGGTIDIQSRRGQGTTLRIKIPLTLAIIPALIVRSQGQRYAIPQVNLLELVGLEGEAARRGIERVHNAPVYRLRGSLLPLIHLDQILGGPQRVQPADGSLYIVVLQADARRFGLLVQEVFDGQEIVVRPLGEELKSLGVFAGATVMGDGQVALILDILGLAQRARVLSKDRDSEKALTDAPALDAESELKPFLVCRLAPGRRVALPLAVVDRLEEFPRARVERAGERAVVQYRGGIMPLLRLSGAPPATPASRDTEAPLQVVVVSHPQGAFGLVVEEIVDIVRERVVEQAGASRDNAIDTLVLQGQVTELLDVETLNRAGGER